MVVLAVVVEGADAMSPHTNHTQAPHSHAPLAHDREFHPACAHMHAHTGRCHLSLAA